MGLLRDDFAALVGAGERTDLARAALAIARIAYPTLDPDPSLHRLDRLAARVRPHLPAGGAADEAVAALGTCLFVECGFRGNQDDYYDPRNSFLNDVLERRTGIPITLSVLMIEVGARLGLPLEGVGFPGHFLVRTAGVLFDPFSGGRRVDEGELLARYRAMVAARGGREPAQVPAEALQTTTTPAILTRMLRNLLHVFGERKDATHALAAADLLLVLQPDAADDIRTRALLYEQLECFAAALADFERYLELAPEAADAERVRERVTRLRPLAAALH
jgi:regulator of sirC expression with transglutaminase-like and TPR domain